MEVVARALAILKPDEHIVTQDVLHKMVALQASVQAKKKVQSCYLPERTVASQTRPNSNNRRDHRMNSDKHNTKPAALSVSIPFSNLQLRPIKALSSHTRYQLSYKLSASSHNSQQGGSSIKSASSRNSRWTRVSSGPARTRTVNLLGLIPCC
jgi:hypothetical protein